MALIQTHEKYFYSYCFFLCLFFCFLFISTSKAIKYETATTNTEILQFQGPVDDGDVDQKLLRIKIEVITGGGVTPCVASMTFALTGFAEMSVVKLYTTNQTETFSGAVLLKSVTPAASVTFNNFLIADTVDNATGFHYYWLLFDANPSVNSGVVIDASYTSGTYATGPPAFANTSPWGFRFTGRNYKIGTGEQYRNIDTAAKAIAQFDYDGTNDIFMELSANYANPLENNAISFSGHTGPATITFRPESGQTGKITSGDPGSGINFITLNGMQKIKFDGRPGGSGTDREWTIRNLRTSATIGSVFVFINEATYDTLRYLNIEGEIAEITNVGLILFSTTTGANGNDSNAVSYCHIRDLTGGTGAMPRNGIYSEGTAVNTNSGTTIDNCHFYDIYDGSDLLWNTHSIRCNNNTEGWTITNNHFYQTSSYSNLDAAFFAIGIKTGGGYTLSGNFIGGQAANCGGSPFTVVGGTQELYGIFFDATTSGNVNNIYDNTIANINYSTNCNVETGSRLVGIYTQGVSDFNIGAYNKGNVIGRKTSNDSIVLTHDGTTGKGMIAISNQSSGAININYNAIGGITVNGSKADATTSIIYNDAGNTTIENNTIGVSGNITITSNSILSGIYVAVQGGSIKRNLIKGLINTSSAGTREINGIKLEGTTWDVHNNVVIIDNASNSNDMPIYGIQDNNSSSPSLKINNNTIKIAGTGSGSSYTTAFYRLAAGVDTVYNNIFQNIRSGGSGGNYAIYASTTAGTFENDDNDLEATEDVNKLGYWGGSSYNLAGWISNTNATAQTISGSTTINAIGVADASFVGADQGKDLFTAGVVTVDKDSAARDNAPWMGAYEGSAALPIELSGFKALCKEKQVVLQWTTLSEINNNYFTVERSSSPFTSEKQSWLSIGKIQGASNSSSLHKYEFSDTFPSQSKINYYRLKQTDGDGKYSYSKIISAHCPTNHSCLFRVYPNPAYQNDIYVEISGSSKNEETLIVVLDFLGRTVYSKVILTKEEGKIVTAIDTKNTLPAGLYTVIASSSNELRYHEKLIIK